MVKPFDISSILKEVFKVKDTSSKIKEYIQSCQIQKELYDEFFQFGISDSDSMSSSGLNKILKNTFPITINNGVTHLIYSGYCIEESGYDLSQCIADNLTFGKRIFLKFKLEGSVDIAVKEGFEKEKFYIECKSKNINVVPVMTDDYNFLIAARDKINRQVFRCPIINIGLLNTDNPNDPETYNLSNTKIYFLADHLSREICKKLKKITRLIEKKSISRPSDISNMISQAISVSIYKCITNPQLCPPVNDINSIARYSQKSEISHLGPFGLKGKRSNIKRRQIHHTHYNRLCPLETPESEAIGLTLHLAKGAMVTRNNTINSKYKNANISSGEEAGKKIGSFYDEKKNGEVLSKTDNSLYLEDIHNIDCWERMPGQFLGCAASLIPFIQHDDPTRATMGAKNMKQSVVLTNAEEPLVKTGFEKEVTDHLNIGRNLLVGYMPWYGYNFEDGIVISEKITNEMASEKNHKTISIPIMGNEKPFCNLSHVKGQTPLTIDGIVSAGIGVNTGDVLVRIHETYITGNEINITSKFREETVPRYVKGKVKKSVYNNFFDDNITLPPRTLRGVVRIEIAEDRPLSVGDKLMGRHGNKGVVSKILPEREMPYFIDKEGRIDNKKSPEYHNEDQPHTHIEIILNPLGVISRMNIGQIMETHVGLVIRRSSEEYKNKFNKNWSPFEKVDIDELENGILKTGIVDKYGRTVLTYWKNDEKVTTERGVVVGYQYIMKLNHMAEDKFHSRSIGPNSTITGQPIKGRGKGGGMRLGEMEVWALQAHNAFHTLNELLGLRSDDPENTGIPRTFKSFVTYLRGVGLSIEFLNKKREVVDSSINAFEATVSFADDEKIKKWSKGEVKNKKRPKVKIVQKKITKQLEVDFDSESLFSKSIFGQKEVDGLWKKNRDLKDKFQMGHIELAKPILHPMFYLIDQKKFSFPNPISKMLNPAKALCYKLNNKKKKYVENTREQKKLLVIKSKDKQIKEGSLITVREYVDNQLLLEAIDIIEICNDKDIINKYEILENDKNNIKNYTINRLPVIPISLRSYLYNSLNGEIVIGDLNDLYGDVIVANNRLATSMKNKLHLSEIHYHKEQLEIAINRLCLFGIAEDGKSKKSILHMLQGKEGLIRQSLLGKRCNFSGRAVIVPDPNIEIDEIVIPWEICRILYPDDKDILRLEEGKRIKLDNRYIILTRAPSLHKYSVQAFKPIVYKGEKALRINPAICNPFNADFDGDQMSIFCISGDKSIAEVKDKLLPQNNIISIANGGFLLSLSLDIRLGLYFMLRNDEAKKNIEKLLGEGINEKNFEEKLKGISISSKRDNPLKDIAKILRKCFEFASVAGISFSIFDLKDLDLDRKTIDDLFKEYFDKYKFNNININQEQESEEYNKIVKDITVKINDKLGIDSSVTGKIKEFHDNPVSIIYTSGAKKDDGQIRQIVGAKGFIQYPLSGDGLAPILSNYYKGLHPFEYFFSTYQSRNNVMDKKLKTAPCGYLTRRLISAAYEIIISTKKLCSSENGLKVDLSKGYDEKRHGWLVGRYLAKDINEGGIKYSCKTQLKKEALLNLKTEIIVRSPITCNDPNGICAFCYGIDLSTGKLAEEGLFAGIIAGQSIGERLTQIAMRSYHSGSAGSIINAFESIEKGFDSSTTPLFNDKNLPFLLDLYENKVNSKHFEVILRCMENGNKRISYVALSQNSFFSAAAFGKAMKIIAQAAADKKTIHLNGFKDRLITGKLINGRK